MSRLPPSHRLLRSIGRENIDPTGAEIATGDLSNNVDAPSATPRQASQQRHYERFAISMPANMADAIRSVCEREARSQSEFFREAVRVYMTQRQQAGHHAVSSMSTVSKPVFEAPTIRPDTRLSQSTPRRTISTTESDSFGDFQEWHSDNEYDQLLNPNNLV